MSTIAEIRVPADELALEQTLTQIPGARFDVERIIAHGDDRAVRFVWASAADPDRLDEALKTDPTIDRLGALPSGHSVTSNILAVYTDNSELKSLRLTN
jgi:hypothetical protein